ncbi:MAG: holin family protein [Pelagimonas sp.]|jgi:hypothetical protein|nr:holin family protein [Pelagimonas sp.]
MGLIDKVLSMVFGGGRNVVAQTAEVFRVNAEAQAGRGHELNMAALAQFAQEFNLDRRGRFDQVIDALNRVPRPAMALGTLGLFVAAMVDPVWFAERMAGIALVPEPLWWLLAAIVSFYFGARHQAKGQEFQRDMAATMAAVPKVIDSLREARQMEQELDSLFDVSPEKGAQETEEGSDDLRRLDVSDNPALADWQAGRT